MAEPQRFLVDDMLGRLAKWLRLLGQDAAYHPGIERSALLRLCIEDPGRILLTRDTHLMRTRPIARREVRAILVRSDGVTDQLRQVVASTSMALTSSRCALCNGELIAKEKVEVESKVPGYVAATQPSFRQCRQCGRIYWEATHWRQIEQTRAALLR